MKQYQAEKASLSGGEWDRHPIPAIVWGMPKPAPEPARANGQSSERNAISQTARQLLATSRSGSNPHVRGAKLGECRAGTLACLN